MQPAVDPPRPEMDDETAMKIESLRDRIARDQYAVDVHAVAAAILARLLARQSSCS